MNLTNWIIVLAFTILNTWFNWRVSLKNRHYHGIFRFVSFECIFFLVFLNYKVWFQDTGTWYQILSWILLGGSALIASLGFVQFYRYGKPEDGLEGTTRLIDRGLYRLIRHPLYLSLILGGFGAMLKDPDWIQILLSVLNTVSLYLTAKVEEGEMIRKFGQDYIEYMNKTKMFVPLVI